MSFWGGGQYVIRALFFCLYSIPFHKIFKKIECNFVNHVQNQWNISWDKTFLTNDQINNIYKYISINFQWFWTLINLVGKIERSDYQMLKPFFVTSRYEETTILWILLFWMWVSEWKPILPIYIWIINDCMAKIPSITISCRIEIVIDLLLRL